MNEVMIFGLKLTFWGMGIVYIVLAIIALIVAIISKLDAHWEHREESQAEKRLESEPTTDNLTVVLISAAIATLLTGRHRIRSIRRVAHTEAASSAWSQQGRAMLLGSHSMSKHSDKR